MRYLGLKLEAEIFPTPCKFSLCRGRQRFQMGNAFPICGQGRTYEGLLDGSLTATNDDGKSAAVLRIEDGERRSPKPLGTADDIGQLELKIVALERLAVRCHSDVHL